uniref:Uncharacterized protein n=1 Tax=Panagrolaimus sp. ES5 TaxID=591445 RepID=A0AC34GQG3_9BILA
MFTNGAHLSRWDKQHACVKEYCDTTASEYSKLNLNQNHSRMNFVQSKSILSDSKANDKNVLNYDDGNLSTAKQNSNSWIKVVGNNYSNYLIDFNSFENASNNLKKDNNISNIANSTLSLHIAAYENLTEASNLDKTFGSSENLKKKHDSFGLGKTWKGMKDLFDGSLSKLQTSVEIPRQQHQQLQPEVMKFKASQKLLDPKQLNLGKEKGRC